MPRRPFRRRSADRRRDRVAVVGVAGGDVGSVAGTTGLRLEGLAGQSSGISFLHLEHAFGELTQRDVMFLDQDPRHRQEPAAVVRESEVFRTTDVDVADAPTLLRQPDPAPRQHFTHDIGHVLPQLICLSLVEDRRIGLSADIVNRLQVGGDARVIEEIGSRCVREFRIGIFKARNKIQLSCALLCCTHPSPPGSSGPAA